jgi:hypothetical protein
MGKVRCPARPRLARARLRETSGDRTTSRATALLRPRDTDRPARGQRQDRPEARLSLSSPPALVRPSHRRRARLFDDEGPRVDRRHPRLVPHHEHVRARAVLGVRRGRAQRPRRRRLRGTRCRGSEAPGGWASAKDPPAAPKNDRRPGLGVSLRTLPRPPHRTRPSNRRESVRVRRTPKCEDEEPSTVRTSECAPRGLNPIPADGESESWVSVQSVRLCDLRRRPESVQECCLIPPPSIAEIVEKGRGASPRFGTKLRRGYVSDGSHCRRRREPRYRSRNAPRRRRATRSRWTRLSGRSHRPAWR